MQDSFDRPAVYEDGGLVYYRASALGGCVKALALARQGYDAMPTPEKMMKVFTAGHEAERQAWKKEYIKGVASHYVTLPITKTIIVAGHMDAWDRDLGYEVKSQSEDEFKPIRESRMWERYSYQISAYMHATGKPLTVVRVLRDADGNISDRVNEYFDEPPVGLSDIRLRVFEVEAMARRDAAFLPCPQEWPCPYYYTHSRTDQMREYCDDQSAVSLAEDYKKVTREAKVADEKVRAARHALLTWMDDKSKVDLPGGWKLSKYKVAEKEISYMRAEYEALRVTEPKEDDDGHQREG